MGPTMAAAGSWVLSLGFRVKSLGFTVWGLVPLDVAYDFVRQVAGTQPAACLALTSETQIVAV